MSAEEATPILITSTGYQSDQKNPTFRYTFANSVDLSNKKVAIASIIMPFSWFNITAAMKNNQLGIQYPTGSTTCSAISITSNVITLTVGNSGAFANGNTIFVTSMAVSTFLNGTYLTNITVVNGTTITAAYVHANVSTTNSENGVVVQITPFTITFPDGGYNISDINTYLEFYFETNNLYSVNASTGAHVYPLSISVNETIYGVTANSIVITSVGYNLPSGSSYTFPSIPTNAQFVFLPNNFCVFTQTISINGTVITQLNGGITGITPQTFPTLTAPASVQSVNSAIAPEVSPIPNLLVSINQVINPYTNNNVSASGIITSTGVSFGMNIVYSPPTYIWNSFAKGSSSVPFIDVVFYDPTYQNTVVLQDRQITMQLLIADKDNPTVKKLTELIAIEKLK